VRSIGLNHIGFMEATQIAHHSSRISFRSIIMVALEEGVPRWIGFAPQSKARGLPQRHLYGERATSATFVVRRTTATERIDRVLMNLVRPSDCMSWEYLYAGFLRP
jgi:hypothetical protein